MMRLALVLLACVTVGEVVATMFFWGHPTTSSDAGVLGGHALVAAWVVTLACREATTSRLRTVASLALIELSVLMTTASDDASWRVLIAYIVTGAGLFALAVVRRAEPVDPPRLFEAIDLVDLRDRSRAPQTGAPPQASP